jgi:hypothetical protein
VVRWIEDDDPRAMGPFQEGRQRRLRVGRPDADGLHRGIEPGGDLGRERRHGRSTGDDDRAAQR